MNFAIAPSIFAKSKESEFAEKVKTEISKLGTGQDAKIKVKLKDGTKLKGYITEANENQFVVMDSKTNQLIPVPYPQVKQAKGNNLSSGVIVIIGVTAVIVLLFVLLATARD